MARARHLVLAVAVVGGGCGGGDSSLDGAPGDDAPDARPMVDAPPPPPTFLDPAVLHTVEITIAAADLVSFDEDQQTRVPCDVTIDGTLIATSGCRKKGGVGSVDPVTSKPAFSIKFDEIVPGQSYAGLDKLVLNNAISDPTLMHEHVAYEVFRRAGVPAHRTAFVQTTLNGVPRGIYVAVEPVDKEFLRAHLGPNEDEGNLYEGSTCDFALNPDCMDLKDEDGSRADLEAAAAAVQTAPDATFAATVGALLDLEEYQRYFAVEIYLDAEDSLSFGRNNYYMYHRGDTGKFVFIAHGQDVLMGNPALDRAYPPTPRLAARVHGIPALRAAVDSALDDAIATGGAGDPAIMAARITDAMALVHTTTRTDDYTLGDLALMDHTAPELATQLAYRAEYVATGGPFPECGDDVVQGNEQCDDGNTADGDGCDGTCVPECTATFAAAGGTWRLCRGGRDWATQRAACDAFGGELAFPADAGDYAAMAGVVRARLGSTDFWLGLGDEGVEGTWRTVAGGVAPYVAFAPNEPNGNAAENCMLSDSGWMRDRSCDHPAPALCRMP
jgi:spore coat protein H